MAYTQTQLTALEAAITKGVRVVQYEGRRIEYQSLKEMQALRDEMRRELAMASGQLRSPFVRFYRAGKGI